MRLLVLVSLLVACNPDAGLKVYDTPPEVSFTSPADGSTIAAGAPVTFTAQVHDAQTELSDLQLVFALDDGSTLSGDLDYVDLGVVFACDGLPAGDRTVTLSALDDQAESGVDTVSLHVVADAAPTAVFVTPEEGAVVAAEDPLRVELRASDNDAADLSALTLAWGDAAEGSSAPTNPDSSGLAAFYLEDLPVGDQRISVTVTDTLGATGTALLAFTVVSADTDGDGDRGTLWGGSDCDDADPDVHGGADEICDGVDDDCDGAIDEDDATDAGTWYADADADGFGDAAVSIAGCDAPAGYVADANDCDDGDAAVSPAAVETCDGIDDDCDGAIDEDDAADATIWYADADADAWGDDGAGVVACDAPAGYVASGGDCDDADVAFHPGAAEADCADPNDYNCDGSTGYADADGDGFAACAECDDGSAGVNPDATELCDGLDDDCDGAVDEDDAADAATWYADADADGYGDASSATAACTRPSGYVADATDCDDGSAANSPTAAERCDAVDNDCDGTIDEDDATDVTTWYADADGDGFGDPGVTAAACSAPVGFVADATDCDDSSRTVSPAAPERCDGVDDDCDGSIDEDDATDAPAWYVDADGDGAAGPTTTRACSQPAGTATHITDCDDGDAVVHPGADERCDGVDDDCDGTIDEDDAVDAPTWYADADGDGWGTSVTASACAAPAGYVADAGDCDDADVAFHPGASEADCADPNDYNCDGSTGYADGDGDGFAACLECDDTVAATHPGATERCNGADDDCDGTADEADAADASTWFADADGDGFGDRSAALTACERPSGYVADATDCDDSNAANSPSSVEICDGADNDCDGVVDEDDAVDVSTWYADADGDGFGDPAAPEVDCNRPTGYVADRTDCADSDRTAFPGATEYCDGADDDCDGTVDESDAADASLWYRDADADGYGAGTGVSACAAPAGYAASSADCDDSRRGVHPAATETCDGLDDDCDGVVDESDAADATTWYADADADGYGDAGAPLVACSRPSGYLADATDCDDGDAAAHPGATETCDGRDDDCDGTTDESDASDARIWYADADADGHGDAASTRVACSAPAGFVSGADDCDDADRTAFPGATEYCDGADDDCDGTVDENDAADAPTWHRDADADGYGGTGSTVACSAPAGYVASSTDCDDARAASNPGATEYCNGYDDDCDGTTDEAAARDASTWYRDADADGFGGTATTVACTMPAGYLATSTDCDDAHALAFPGGTEVCDGLDNDCDGRTDDASAADVAPWYGDTDGDGYGDADNALYACTRPSGYVADATDCDDTVATTWPGATEYCNLADDDCDGTIDEDDASDAVTWYLDADADGYGLASVTDHQCEQPTGYVATAGECDDAVATVHPGATEVCDGVDQDCDGTIDDSASDATTWYRDADGDSYGVSATHVSQCTAPSGYVSASGDCNDTSSTVNPAATETCNSVDDDCDGTVDDGAGIYYPDSDGDGLGDANSVPSCTRGSGYLTSSTDCDDSDANTFPGAPETCDGVANDCNTADTWVESDEDGIVSFIGSSGLASDYTAEWTAGNSVTSVRVTAAPSGTYYVCAGTYYTRVYAATGNIHIESPEGVGAENVILDAADDGPVIQAAAGSVTVGEVTLQNGTYGISTWRSAELDGTIIRDNSSNAITTTNTTSSPSLNHIWAYDCTIKDNGYSIASSHYTVDNCTFDNTTTGYALDISSSDSATNNTFIGNGGGIDASTSISGNTFIDNGTAIYWRVSTTVTGSYSITDNTFDGNGHAINLATTYNSSHSQPSFTISDNTFINGTGTQVLLDMYANVITMDNNVFEDNTSSSHSTTAPGAIYYTQDYTGYTLSITNSTFNRNTAYERGGAIQTVNGSISISDSTFADNGLNPADSCTTSTYACEGGTIYQYGYTLVLDNVTITGGDAIDAGSAHPYRYGGGLYIANVTSASLTDVTISDCNAYQGGGLYISGATTTVSMTNSLVEDSTASYGGGAYMSGGSLLTCTGSTSTTAGFLGNYGSTAGGGVYGGVRSTVCDWGATGTADDNTEGASFLTSDVYSGGRRSYGDDATF